MTLAEVLIAIFIVGVVLSAFAATIMTSLRAINVSEREVRATALAQEAIEELQSVAWESAGLYTNEVAAAPADWNGGNTTTFDGDDLVLLPTPAVGARLAQVPEPRTQELRGHVIYTVDRYITWIDGNGDGTRETKRFTTVVTWPDRSGSMRTLRAVGERVPTQSEAPSTSVGTRVLSITGAPDPSELDHDSGRNLEDLTITVRLNQGVRSTPQPKVTFYSLEDDSNDYTLRTLLLAGSELDDNSYRGRWTGTISAGEYRFARGDLNLLFTATDAEGDLLEAYGSVQMFGGELGHVGPAPTPPREGGDQEAFPHPPAPSDPDEGGTTGEVRVLNIHVSSPICVDKSTWRLKKPVTLTMNAKGLTEEDGNIQVTYLTWTETHPNRTKVVTDSAKFVSGGLSSSSFRLDIPETAERLFRPGQSVTFSAKGLRSDGANHTLETSPISVSDSC
jgi:type II secretory pathway pseudopilin PulG